MCRGFESLCAYVTDANEVRQVLDNVLNDLSTATAVTVSLESVIESMKTQLTLLGVGSNNMSREHRMAQALSRTMMEIATIYNRLQMLRPELEQWRSDV
jgi:hypothetical protein